ncbi:MAG: hypothetical protein A3C06_02730 [Candidatus Taylorbacteria bacterium RIFCSPHIGHO2_02_FULL_46_13]|uniref:Glycosyltransferase 2-like domain-containing protein n=1 Tax=Candidatus Taylorbacteria bacterium RIFCSPHIGHO2_02_FULL_46_13 TaxID=1802312 RepID=A0A1G2MRE6_9BACT|nr:MAG: hypothetical protein A3C06_02730 [Candidatus Taylorbacteria bacterium RIFCSPHIGHO2_02_FULL_46_13]
MCVAVQNSQKIPCTLALLTRNSALTLARALESAKDFAEIIVCDGGSTDGTLAIARAFGARIIAQDARFKDTSGRIIDFAGVRNQTLKAAIYDWFFYLDSDELMTSGLAGEIHSHILKNMGMNHSGGGNGGDGGVGEGRRASCWWVDRKYMIDDKTIDCAATYPTRQMRFFHRDTVTEFIKPIHERINPKSDALIKTTENFMLVPISPDPRVWRDKWKHYIELEIARRGKISFWDWVDVCMENAKISFLYAFRLVRNAIFYSGTKMPLALEWERHVYHWNLCKALWSNTR